MFLEEEPVTRLLLIKYEDNKKMRIKIIILI